MQGLDIVLEEYGSEIGTLAFGDEGALLGDAPHIDNFKEIVGFLDGAELDGETTQGVAECVACEVLVLGFTCENLHDGAGLGLLGDRIGHFAFYYVLRTGRDAREDQGGSNQQTSN